MEPILTTILNGKSLTKTAVVSLGLKLVLSEITTRVINAKFEGLLDKEIDKATRLNSYKRLNNLKMLKDNIHFLKNGLRGVIYGAIIPQDLSPLINHIADLIRICTSPKPKPKNKALNDFAEIVKIRFRDLPKFVDTEKVKNPGIDLKMSARKRECELIKKYIPTQPRLLEEMKKSELQKYSVGDRITRYCTTQVNNTIKRIITHMRNQPVKVALQTVEKQSYKALNSINQLPQHSPKALDLTNDLMFGMQVLNTYTDYLRKNANSESIAYFKEKILPDLFVIYTAIHREANK